MDAYRSLETQVLFKLLQKHVFMHFFQLQHVKKIQLRFIISIMTY